MKDGGITMGKIIRVTPEQLEAASKKLHEYAISYTEIYSRLMQQAETMGEAWQGADNLSYVEQINGFCDNLQEAGDILLQQKTNYVNRQEDNIAQVKKLTN